MNPYYLAQQESTGYRAFSFRNAAIAQAYIAAHRLRNCRPASNAHGRMLDPIQDLTHLTLDDFADTLKLDTITQEAMTMTTTPQKSAAHLAVEELAAEVRILRGLIEEARKEQAATYDLLVGLTDLLQKPAPATATPPAPDVHGNGYAVFLAESIVMTFNDAGEPRYKAKGGKYAKFGVNVWPEALPALGIDAKTLKPGPNPFGKMVRAELGETQDASGEKSMTARKVIGLAE